MKKNVILFLGLVSLHAAIFAQTSSSKWQKTPLIIDGNVLDWETNPRFFNSESKVEYEFRNDATNLYVVLKTTDRATQMQMMQAGFGVKFKVKNDAGTRCSITFPVRKMKDPAPFQNEGRLVEKENLRTELVVKDSAILEGFLLTKGLVTSDNKTGLCFARSKGGRGATCYEFQIPLAELVGEKCTLAQAGTIPIQLQVSINSLSMGEVRNMQSHMAKRMGGGMQGGGPGGMGGEMGGMPGGDRGYDEMQMRQFNGSLLSKKSFSIEFQLSVQ